MKFLNKIFNFSSLIILISFAGFTIFQNLKLKFSIDSRKNWKEMINFLENQKTSFQTIECLSKFSNINN